MVLQAAAIQTFRNILVWMGDRPAQECQRIASVGLSMPMVRAATPVPVQMHRQGEHQHGTLSKLSWQILRMLVRGYDEVSSDPFMRDETFVQILKHPSWNSMASSGTLLPLPLSFPMQSSPRTRQLSGNPSARSEWLGWQLLLQRLGHIHVRGSG